MYQATCPTPAVAFCFIRRSHLLFLMRIILFANGDMPHPDQDARLLRPDDFILCADGGTHHALALGLTPDLIIGDLDSSDAAIVAELRAAGVAIREFPRDKDYTDLELALQAARELQPDAILLLGALGGRLDQMLANILLLASPDYADLPVTLVSGQEEARVVRDAIELRGRPGDIVSVIPLTPDVAGLTYGPGLRWRLDDAILPFGSSRGVSNELVAETASISLRSGVILVIHTKNKV